MALRTIPKPVPLARLFFGATLAISLAGVAVSAVFWVVSLNVATSEEIVWLNDALSSVLSETQKALLTGLSDDASTITPLILLMFFFGGLRGSWSYLFRFEQLPRQLARSHGAYPFPARYQSTWIQLGLIGTLWSFLLLGTQLKVGIDPAESVTILVIAFGTALLSTFAGVVGAYVLGPLVSKVFQGVLARVGAHPESTPSLLRELTVELGGLAAGVATASRSLATAEGEKSGPAQSLSRSVGETTLALGRLREHVEALNPEAALGRWTDALVDRLTDAWDDRLCRVEGALAADRESIALALRTGLRELGESLGRGRGELAEGLRLIFEQAEQRREAADARGRELLSSGLKAVAQDLAALTRQLEAASERRSEELSRTLEALPGRLGAELAVRWPRPPAIQRARPEPDAEPTAPTPEAAAVERVGRGRWAWLLGPFLPKNARKR